MNWPFLRNVLLKSLILFLVINIIFAVGFPLATAGRISLYNCLFPGRERFPFGENPEKSYNLSLYNLEAMLASHQISGSPKQADEFRVFVLGDSSVWGTLLRPEDTLSGQLNQLGLTSQDGRKMRFYNLGYPTVSLTKDVMLLEKAMKYQPDLVIWLVTLEAFPWEKQFSSPLVENNQQEVLDLMKSDNVDLSQLTLETEDSSAFIDRTIIFQRRALADLLRLQAYGVMWAATGIDQEYFENYSPAQRDFEVDDLDFQKFAPGEMNQEDLAFQILDWGTQVASPASVFVVNEPMLISAGENSGIRYNFFYPRWAYDLYRDWLSSKSQYSSWQYLDTWNIAPDEEFTNSAIHLTPVGSRMLAETIAKALESYD